MCGRYFFDTEDYEIMVTDPESPALDFAGGEVYPNSVAPVLTASNQVELSRWGKPVEWGSGSLLHARAETVAEKPTFREAFETTRCMIPTSGYFEWLHIDGKSQRGKKYFFRRPDQGRLYLAGLLLPGEEGPCFVIITREAGAFMQDFHNRMPQTLEADQVKAWLTDASFAGQLLEKPQAELVSEYKGK